MKHKQIILIALFWGALATTLSAQPGSDDRGQRVRAYRAAVFTEVLQLTPAEAEGFWPVYNAHQEQREALHKQQRPLSQLDAMSDAEVEEYVKKHIETKQRELDLEKELVYKLRKVLPLRKIAKLPVAERELRERLVQKLKDNQERKAQRRPNNRN
jgi:hypothetical protein